jgi:large subunit ribosomal protein L18
MPTTATHHQNILRRTIRSRAKLAINQATPRLSVHRSLRHISAQIIDDANGRTLAASHDYALTDGNKTEQAAQVGAALAAIAKKAGVTAVRFDRGPYKYHGRVAALANAAREAGLTF